MKITLELINELDFSKIVDIVNEYDSDFLVQWAGLTYKYPLSVEQMEEHYNRGINTKEGNAYVYKIKDTELGRFIGSIQLARFDEAKKEAVIGRFIIDNKFRGKGIGQAALKHLVRLGFEQFELNRLKLNVFHINKGAIKCYEKVGFQQIDVNPKLYKSSTGEWWDQIQMLLSKKEWIHNQKK
ncbi:GNAT family N-acetyltransferase [Chengkuizengella axinellae]|uniref:GNAT family protein n=1 Tax=Chengkuizengella axinellae TaxID=3064388 RepID=A0ABT9IZR0_9BACL|nr:GNAT family protein [Chengkuizengella sp. 2205SS18-9]MDP5274274.1 GNAT family protein [Chengkuizengella sp. 2205SS18-9]